MKNVLQLLSIMFSFLLNGQIAVTDFGANAQLNTIQANLTTMSTTLSSLSAGMSTLNTTQTATKVETVNNTKQTLDQLGISKAAENYLKQVPQYLKRGQEINQILGKEQQIVQRIQNLSNLMNKNNIPQSARNLILNNVGQILSNTGSTVDLALNVLTDSVFRMEAENRRDYLKELNSIMDRLLSVFGVIEAQVTSYSAQIQTDNSYKEAYNKVLKTIKN